MTVKCKDSYLPAAGTMKGKVLLQRYLSSHCRVSTVVSSQEHIGPNVYLCAT